MKSLDGTVLALGTVGLVAVAGAFRARGSLSTHRWVYHLTYRDNLPGIARRGLVPRSDTTEAWDNEPGTYFVNNFGYEAGPGADPEYSAWLRFPAPSGTPQTFFREDSQEGRTMNTIPADTIEVLVDADGGMAMYEEDGRWVRLLDFVRGSRNTRSPVSHVLPQPSALREPGDRRSHFNLNTGGYTLDVYRDGGWRMERNTDPAVLLNRAYFRYSPSGHRDYLASFAPSMKLKGKWAGLRGVHAWIYGKPIFEKPNLEQGWRKARYSDGRPIDADPNRSGAGTPACFVDLETGACLPNDRSIDVWLDSAPNTPDASGRVGLKYRNGRVPMLKPVMYWRAR